MRSRTPIALGALFMGVSLLLVVCSATLASHSRVEFISAGGSGPAGGWAPTVSGASADGARVVFHTSESLLPQDTDGGWTDVYERAAGVTRLLSTGPSGGNGSFHAQVALTTNPDRTNYAQNGAVSDDARTVLIVTAERLTSSDTDSNLDLYQAAGGITSLVSTGPTGGNGPRDVYDIVHVSSDGSRVFFQTPESLVPADTDQTDDVYERTGGTTTLVSQADPCCTSPVDSIYLRSISRDGSHVFFWTQQKLVSADSDTTWDVYERFAGSTILVSTGPLAGSDPLSIAELRGLSRDGTRVFFQAGERLVAEDTDGYQPDIYERSGGNTTLVSNGSANSAVVPAEFQGASRDGTRVFFRSKGQFTLDDLDSFSDTFERSGGNTTLVTTGPTNGNCQYNDCYQGFVISPPSTTSVFFDSGEQLVAQDADTGCQAIDDENFPYQTPCLDVYKRTGGTTTLLSAGPSGGNGPFQSPLMASSDDGSRIFFQTPEQLVSADTDAGCNEDLEYGIPPGPCDDVYERVNGATTLAAPTGGSGSANAGFVEAASDGTWLLFHTTESLVPTDTDAAGDLYLARLRAPSYDVPAEASPISVSLVPELRQTISNSQCQARGGMPSTHGSPLAFSSCSPPAYAPNTPSRLRGSGTATLVGVPGQPSTPADEADLALAATLTDVRTAAGADYNPNPTGADLTLVARFRVTDTYNGGALTDPATTLDFELATPVGCTGTPDPGVGSTCSVNTSADAVQPGAIRERSDMVMQTFRVRVNDAGPNGIRGDADDKRLASQGIYVP